MKILGSTSPLLLVIFPFSLALALACSMFFGSKENSMNE
ncbi:hypothetical protein A2U01_0081578 [Trifolium medium]|uniref:Uncharacterized protein n=1 Tax=Trifolium medium TaxID=97028 RepID=A0A392TH94_9FABA|nr:hypothetical protein [Trifolium medium]